MTSTGEDQRPPGWYPDPYGRHPFRWWDGSAWTGYAGAETVAWDPTGEEETAPLPSAPPGLWLALIGAVLGIVATFVSIETFLEDDSVAVQMGISSLLLWAGLIGAWLAIRFRARGTSIDLRFGWRDIGFGFAGSLVGRVLAGVAIAPIPFPDQKLRDFDDGAADVLNGTTWVVLILVTVVGAPLVEEIFFRGIVQRRLVTRIGVVPGIVVASLIFGAAHLIGWEGPLSLANAWAIAAGGLVLGVLYHLTGRLGTAIAAHAFFNAQAMLLIALFGS